MTAPVFINCRDRLSALAELVTWLEQAGCDEIWLIDNHSLYQPLLAFYEKTPHQTIRLNRNYGKFALWEAPGLQKLIQDRHFIYTDPDIVPDPGCPSDVFDRLRELLDRYNGVNKAGLGLLIDDIPMSYPHRNEVLAWELGKWQWPLEPGVFYAAIDTTFAMYRPAAYPRPLDAARTGRPYVARHLPWYSNPDSPSEEDAFYEARAEEDRRGSWQAPTLPAEFVDRIAQRRLARPTRLNQLRWQLRGRRAVRLGHNLRRTQDGS